MIGPDRGGASPEAIVALSTAPLSPGQERLLDSEYTRFANARSSDGDPTWLRPVDTGAIFIEGTLSDVALGRAVNALVERQSALRTTFRFPLGTAPIQIILPHRERTIRVEQSRGSRDLSALVAANTGRKITPSDSDLFAVRLIRIDSKQHLLLLEIHHLVSDGWSLGVLYRELSEMYSAFIERREPRLAELPISFADACTRMRAARTGSSYAPQLDYWREETASPSPDLRFFGATKKPFTGLTPVDDLPVRVDARLLSELKVAGARSAVPGSAAGTVLAALALVIHAQTGETRIDIGSMIAGRTSADTENLIGNFVNTVVVRIALDLDSSLSDLVAQVNSKLAAAIGNQDVPIQDVVEQARHAREEAASAPLFHVTVALNNMRRESLRFSGVDCRDVFRTEEGELLGERLAPTAMALRWIFEECPDGLRGTVTFDARLFDKEKMTACLHDLTAALNAIARTDGTVRSVIGGLESRTLSE